MANENTIKYVILGLLSHEPMTGYELKKRMDTTMSLFWSGSFGSIYPTLQRLKVQNAIKGEDKKGEDIKGEDIKIEEVKSEGTKKDTNKEMNRSKIRYEITETGRTILREWMNKPVTKDEIRYETLLKMFFGDQIERGELMRHIDRFEEKAEVILPKLQNSVELLKKLEEEPAHEYYMLTAMFGVRMYEASLAWCQDVRDHFAQKEKE